MLPLLKDIAIGESCRILNLGGSWRVIETSAHKVKVQNNASNIEYTLPKNTPVRK